MPKPKRSPGRPKHVAEYATGTDAQRRFADAMKAVLTPKKPEKKQRSAAR